MFSNTRSILGFAMVLGSLVAATAVVGADGRSYVNATGDVLLVANPDALPDGSDLGLIPFSLGGGCFEAGHITGPVAIVCVHDDTLSTASGFYYQDTDGDGEPDP